MPDIQTDAEVTNELFEQRKESLDRYSALLNILFVVVGFYYAIMSFTIEKISADANSNDLITTVDDANIILCVVFLLIAFAIIITNMFKTLSYNKLIRKENSIQFRENNNLPQYNLKLFSSIKAQECSYILASFSLTFSLFSLLNYFLKNQIFFWFISGVMIISVALFVLSFIPKWFCKVFVS